VTTGDITPNAMPAATLSRREREVLEMTSLGLTNGQIASRLDVTTHAVKFHLASVYRKLGVANRTEAAVAYLSWQRTNTNTDGSPLVS
jgi:DNA-binding CsgD family transcriptional regulator